MATTSVHAQFNRQQNLKVRRTVNLGGSYAWQLYRFN